MITYPNQKIIHINKSKYTNNFLQIGIDEWQAAAKELSPAAFKLYLYLASNADGYDLALSQKAVENAIGIKKTSYHTAVKELNEKGYINTIQGNIEAFSTAAVRKSELCQDIEDKNKNEVVRKSELISSQKRTTEFANPNLEVRKSDREIDKQILIDKTNNKVSLPSAKNGADAPSKSKEDELTKESKEILAKFNNDMENNKLSKYQIELLESLNTYIRKNKGIITAAALHEEINDTYYLVYDNAALVGAAY